MSLISCSYRKPLQLVHSFVRWKLKRRTIRSSVIALQIHIKLGRSSSVANQSIKEEAIMLISLSDQKVSTMYGKLKWSQSREFQSGIVIR